MEKINPLNIKKLLKDAEYRIPIYQRNYAWGIAEVTQLIQDIADYAKDKQNDNYYIGTLVVFPHKEQKYFETIDGQQRLTTLTIIACSIKNHSNYDISWYKEINVSFDHRERSNETLSKIYSHKVPNIESEKINTEIATVYKRCWGIISKVCEEKGINTDEFIKYLLSNVMILRVEVPEDTDLNHYFEIMNSRGEQLEQHEIVKASLMSELKDSPDDMQVFNIIWEACSNMGRYVQINVNKNIRSHFFTKDEIDGVQENFDLLSERVPPALTKQESNSEKKSLTDLFREDLNKVPYIKPWEEQGKNAENPETYGTIISFSNFLLHVLKIIFPNNKDIVLDDKKLITTFDIQRNSAKDKKGFVKKFIMTLLKTRYLFDKYIIKRKLEKWSLKKLKQAAIYGSTFSKQENGEDIDEKDIIMLQAMFHVSLPSQIYKHWLNAALLYVTNNPDTTSKDYCSYLWSLAKAYMLDRYLAKDENLYSFDTIIYQNNGVAQNETSEIDWDKINANGKCTVEGERIENFVFNFYDYLLYKEQNVSDFEFSYRTSVEHFYPQHPIDNKMMDYDHLHSFGNLCLVSHTMNSKFSNSLPKAKYVNYGTDADALKSYSIKLRKMMQSMKDHDIWSEEKIDEETLNAKNLIEKHLR